MRPGISGTLARQRVVSHQRVAAAPVLRQCETRQRAHGMPVFQAGQGKGEQRLVPPSVPQGTWLFLARGLCPRAPLRRSPRGKAMCNGVASTSLMRFS